MRRGHLERFFSIRCRSVNLADAIAIADLFAQLVLSTEVPCQARLPQTRALHIARGRDRRTSRHPAITLNSFASTVVSTLIRPAITGTRPWVRRDAQPKKAKDSGHYRCSHGTHVRIHTEVPLIARFDECICGSTLHCALDIQSIHRRQS